MDPSDKVPIALGHADAWHPPCGCTPPSPSWTEILTETAIFAHSALRTREDELLKSIIGAIVTDAPSNGTILDYDHPQFLVRFPHGDVSMSITQVTDRLHAQHPPSLELKTRILKAMTDGHSFRHRNLDK